MADIALVWNSTEGHADLAMNATGTDLLIDDGLITAVTISLFTDALAPPGAPIPDGSADRRGYWGDMPVDPTDDVAAGSTGSLLWLYENGLQTQPNLLAIQDAAQTALAWLTQTGIAGSVNATATYPTLGQCDLQIDIEQQGASRSLFYANIWANS